MGDSLYKLDAPNQILIVDSVHLYVIVSPNKYIPAKFHDFSVMLTNLEDSHDLTIVFWKKNITHEFEEESRFSFLPGKKILFKRYITRDQYLETDWFVKRIRFLRW